MTATPRSWPGTCSTWHHSKPHRTSFGTEFGSQRRERELLFTFGDDPEPRRATQSPSGRLRPRGQASRMSYCPRAVSHCVETNIEKVYLPALTAPRAGLEPAAYCLGGMIRAWLDAAGHGRMRYLPAAAIAGQGWMSPGACRRWLPVWLPGISLAPLRSRHSYLPGTLAQRWPPPGRARIRAACLLAGQHPAAIPSRPGRSTAASATQAAKAVHALSNSPIDAQS